MVEKQTNKVLKCLRAYNGLEFCNEPFDNFCKSNGIVRHRTVRHTPQQNGVAERLNRTLIERVRCQLAEAMLSEKYWAETASYIVHTLNRCPHTSTNFITPEEKWTGKPPNLQYLKVFGCVGFLHQRLGKLKARVVKYMFLRLTEGVKGYRLWHPVERRCINSRDVTFREQEMYMLHDKTSEKSLATKDTHIEVEHNAHSSNTETEPENAEEEDSEQRTEDEATEMIQEHPDLQNYSLARDKQRRNIVPPARFSEADCISLALNGLIL
ncbi:MAG: hypothetical protein Q8836_02375 [Sweet potato little leaf phytoplasma]|nr:hypothetical protein [Sweet potato little leaf phytoplasma]